MIERPQYQELLAEYLNTPSIKVLQGVRRCGKSTLLAMIQDDLLRKGVPPENIFSKRFDSFEEPLDYSAEQLHNDIGHAFEARNANNMFYVFLDEIQDIDGWEKVVRRLHTKNNMDVYITESNAHLLSSDLATYLSGRTTKIEIFPLSFKEYMDFSKQNKIAYKSIREAFDRYIRYGGMPGLFSLKEMKQEFIGRELSSITDTVLLNDVAQRTSVRDIALLEKLVVYIFSTSGNLYSIRNVVNTLKSAGIKTSAETVENYISALRQAYILYEAKQSGIAGKQVLNPLRKFYAVDLGLRNLSIGFTLKDRGFQLENVVFLELKRRGYDVAVGTLRDSEIDFVATRYDEKAYIQVCDSLLDENVMKRELAPLRRISDGFQKVVLVLDDLALGTTDDGIRVLNIIDWLLK